MTHSDGAATGTATASGTAVRAALAAGGCGCLTLPVGAAVLVAVLFVLGGLAVLLFPIVVIVLFFMGQLGGGDLGGIGQDLTTQETICEDAERRLGTEPDQLATRAQDIFLGDGRGALELTPPGTAAPGHPCTVPENLLLPITDAGSVCDAIGPVTIAAQIQYETRFDSDFVGPNGAEGISQVPPDVFDRLREDGDPFDAEQSIDAQADYLCELADETQALIDNGTAVGNPLDLTLAAYDVGMDAVREAGGLPATEEAQSYVTGVRSWFAPMEGVGPPPRTMPATSGLIDT
ncbi:lytic transglycosylase domain-containing protein [Streptomyces antibioticus]|uniref:lytic transglycosylase domain-containing protein n=1 Tax=Streptomyces antibioticus TaxID=1890 RepID=UPI0036F819CB